MQYKETELMAAEATAKTQNVHKTSLIKPYIEKQIANYKAKYAQANPSQLTINSFIAESQDNIFYWFLSRVLPSLSRPRSFIIVPTFCVNLTS